MSVANPKQIALQNLRDFQEMSYMDVYSLISQHRFKEAKAKYAGVLENIECRLFDEALAVNITTPHDDLLEFLSEIASNAADQEKIAAVGFDLSAHVIRQGDDGSCNQGIEVCLYDNGTYNFSAATDEEMKSQCESGSKWKGRFINSGSFMLAGLGGVCRQFMTYAQSDKYNPSGIVETADGNNIVDVFTIARHVAKLLVAIEYHRYMAEFIPHVEVPVEMLFIMGEHGEIEVPVVFYRVGADLADTDLVDNPQQSEQTPPLYHEPETVVKPEAVAAKAETVLDEEADMPENLELEPKSATSGQDMAKVAASSITRTFADIQNNPPAFGQRNNTAVKTAG